jgi:hypothetical protein
MLLPHLFGGGKAVILAEEWHTVNAVLQESLAAIPQQPCRVG